MSWLLFRFTWLTKSGSLSNWVYFGLIGFSLFIDIALFRVSIVLNFLPMPLGNSVSFFYSDKLIQSGANLIKRIKVLIGEQKFWQLELRLETESDDPRWF